MERYLIKASSKAAHRSNQEQLAQSSEEDDQITFVNNKTNYGETEPLPSQAFQQSEGKILF